MMQMESEILYSLEDTVIKKVNQQFDNLSKLNSCSDIELELKERKKQIENSLFTDRSDVPSKISTTLSKVQSISDKNKNLSVQFNNLNKSLNIYEEKVLKIQEIATNYILKIETLEKIQTYLEVVSEIEEISNSLEVSNNEENERKQILQFAVLKSIFESLENTKCEHLLSYVGQTTHYWHEILKDKLVADFEDILKVIDWPTKKPLLTSETLNRFQTLSEYLLKIQLKYEPESLHIQDFSFKFEPLNLPMVELIRPLEKRFQHHFMSAKKTNRLDKPEWFFTSVFNWINLQENFIEESVQPVYSKILGPRVNAKVEFMRGIIKFVFKKLVLDLNKLAYEDESLFAHYIDETLGFEKELRTIYNYPASEPSVTDVLAHNKILGKWIHAEKHSALEKMHTILDSPTAFKEIFSLDWNHCVTECANSFLTILSTITERYEVLSDTEPKLKFLNLQQELIEYFSLQLEKKLEEENIESSSEFHQILNTVDFIIRVLEEWSVNTVFIHLKFYMIKKEKWKFTESCNVFDDSLRFLTQLRDDLLSTLTKNIFMEFKSKITFYKKLGWQALELVHSDLRPSPEASGMFQFLITNLHQLQKVLTEAIFKEFLKMLASKIDNYLFYEIVLCNFFNDAGGRQFDYDITKNLFPLFRQYSIKPETNFPLSREACILLSINKGVALTIKEAVSGRKDEQYDVKEILAEIGINNLGIKYVVKILSSRTDLE